MPYYFNCKLCGKEFHKNKDLNYKYCSRKCCAYSVGTSNKKEPSTRSHISYFGYPMVYLPEHHRADPKGYVYEHVIIAEKMLGRLLNKHEVCHHLDGNKCNNTMSNIYVCNDHSEHLRMFHAKYMAQKRHKESVSLPPTSSKGLA